MDSALANKAPMTKPDDIELRIQKTVAETKEIKRNMDFWIGEYEERVNRLVRYDTQNGTNYAAAFKKKPVKADKKARDTGLVKRVVSDHNFQFSDENELALLVRQQGGGSDDPDMSEEKAVGYIRSGIKHMIRKGTLVRRKDGKIGLP